MAASQFNRYIWLVDTIRRAGRISRQDIDRRWAVSSLNDRKETFIPERTFHRYKDAIQELFDIEIFIIRRKRSNRASSRGSWLLLSRKTISDSDGEQRNFTVSLHN